MSPMSPRPAYLTYLCLGWTGFTPEFEENEEEMVEEDDKKDSLVPLLLFSSFEEMISDKVSFRFSHTICPSGGRR